ncbi:MAG TPA: nuclear transport factor 2 family protein [Vicinamibacteria bacterium]|jgi:ketosteroid isomerase-like protein|nr:nuclear transport factor 2 family protein [Vicinamibacteria bacterium]
MRRDFSRAVFGAGWQSASPPLTPNVCPPFATADVLAARERVWQAWFANDHSLLRHLISDDVLAINAGEETWQDCAAVLQSASNFARSGRTLVRLMFPRTEVQRFGDVAILYSAYDLEIESTKGHEKSTGRATEVFVYRDGRWVHPGWHMDSGR